MMRRRPTAAGLAAALGLPAPDAASKPAPAPAPEVVAEPVAPAEPEPAAASPAPPVRRGRMGGVVVPAAAVAPVAEVGAPVAPVASVAPREQPTTPRPVLLRRADDERHPIPDEWLDERGSPFPRWYLTDTEMRELVDAAPPGPTCRATWPGCLSQICPIVEIGMDHTPFQDWTLGSRKTIQDTRYRGRGR